MAVAVPPSPPAPSSLPNDSPPKKRKRAAVVAEDLEIDINAPEPPSKKALRKVKKAKTDPASRRTLQKSDQPQSEKESKQKLPTDDAVHQKPSTVSNPSTLLQEESAPSIPSKPKKERSPHGIWIGNLSFLTTKSSLRNFLTSSTSSIINEMITRIHLPKTSSGTVSKSKSKSKSKSRDNQGKGLKKDEEQEAKEDDEDEDADGGEKGKAQNRGFAYVDFKTPEAVFEALQLSEMILEGRRVLIKDANDFQGRPKAVDEDEAAIHGGNGAPTQLNGTPSSGKASSSSTSAAMRLQKSKRIFIGNLPFDATAEDLERLYAKCGGKITHCQVATFEDSGKCKGYAWVEFDSVEAAEGAKRGWVDVFEKDEGEDEDEEDGQGEDDKEEADGGDSSSQNNNDNNAHIDTETSTPHDDTADQSQPSSSSSKPMPPPSNLASSPSPTGAPRTLPLQPSQPKFNTTSKRRKHRIFMNRLHGRPLRVEYAEDKLSRYKKRYGKGGTARNSDTSGVGAIGEVQEGKEKRGQIGNDTSNEDTAQNEVDGMDRKAGDRKGEERPKSRIERKYGDAARKSEKKVDARTIKPGAALAHAPRQSGAIVEGKGRKTVF